MDAIFVLIGMVSTTAKPSTYERAIGAIFGLVAGDRIGGPTRMALLFGASLCRKKGYSSTDVLESYLRWFKKGGFDTGATTARVFSALCSGVGLEQAVRSAHRAPNQAGCNPMHRSIPLAVASFISEEEIDEVSRKEARLTHYSAIAGEMASFSNRICRELIEGTTPSAAIEKVLGEQRGSYMNAGRADLEPNGFAPSVLKASIHFLLHTNSFEDALRQAIRFAAPANYSPPVLGAWAGALYGFSAISKDRYNHCRIASQIAILASNLSEGYRGKSDQ